MAEDSISLKTFILGDPPNAALAACVAGVTAALKKNLADGLRLDWSDLAGDIAEKLEQMFDISLTDILAEAWKDYQGLADSADPAKHSADETISLPMAEHRVETTLRPCLEIVVGARPPIRVTFEIACELELKGVVLKIQDARIRAVRIATCRAKGTVKCQGLVLLRRESKELELPGRITMPRGIPIKRPFQSRRDAVPDRELLSAIPA